MTQKKEYVGTFIPAHIMEDAELTPGEKILYAEIASYKRCFASNEYLGKRLGVGERMVRKSLMKLEEMGYIKRVEFNGRARTIVPLRDEPEFRADRNHSSAIDNSIDNKERESAGAPPICAFHAPTGKPGKNCRDCETNQRAVNRRSPPPPAVEPGNNPVRNLLQEIIEIVNPREKITDDRMRNLHARLKDYTADEIVAAARELAKSAWHMANNQMTIDNLIRPSKFGRWHMVAQEASAPVAPKPINPLPPDYVRPDTSVLYPGRKNEPGPVGN